MLFRQPSPCCRNYPAVFHHQMPSSSQMLILEGYVPVELHNCSLMRCHIHHGLERLDYRVPLKIVPAQQPCHEHALRKNKNSETVQGSIWMLQGCTVILAEESTNRSIPSFCLASACAPKARLALCSIFYHFTPPPLSAFVFNFS